ncbi:Glu/Leu/Phe/Val dehydrogenase dimerization domain-containing protein [Amycolatopsis sp. NPDC088138]|uniref:Glu/Leu/Phe/Val dehydrogenase dimerization domain-containing protein n=1 Tax=Amycolatopsis sp. NPDC088138 TaxID=3363938 RepID=UPI0038100051
MRPAVERIRTGAGVTVFVVREDDPAAGPANGGLRVLPYGTERHALADGLRLARRMTVKHALYRTGFSGAKLTAVADPSTVDRLALMRAVGEVLDRHAGRLYTGCDMNTTAEDMRVLSGLSPYVLAGVGSAVDASLATAHGVVAAVRQAAGGDVGGRGVLVHGVGKTGAAVAALLAAGGARVTTYDHDPAAPLLPGCTPLHPLSAWWARPEELLVLCSASGVVDERVAERLRCRVVVSGANCPYTNREVERILARRGVLCVPDVVANAGAVIGDSIEHHQPERFRTGPPEEVYRFVAETVAERTSDLLRRSSGAPDRVGAALAELLEDVPGTVCGLRFAPARV